MPLRNSDISEVFNKIADMLEIKGNNIFRIRAYRDAARNIGDFSGNLADMVKKDEDLTRIHGIGKDLAGKIKELVEEGKLSYLDRLKKDVPEELTDLMEIPGLGGRRIHTLFTELSIRNLADLEKAARDKKIRELEGFGAKTEEKILAEIEGKAGEEKRTRIDEAKEITDPLIEYLSGSKNVTSIEVAGSYRRGRETVGDIDILAICEDSSQVMDLFVGYEDVQRVISKGTTRSSVILRSGLQVDLRVVPEESYGAALHYFTGSKEHNIEIRRRGQDRGLKVNEYGVFKGKRRVAGESEEDLFGSLDLHFIPPELRENRGEIEMAEKGKLPHLVKLEDIKGDLHSHTLYTDGRCSLKEMAEEARNRGYSYLAITEHSRHVTVAGGLGPGEVLEQIEEINSLNSKSDDFVLLKGIEVDILEDGSLDLPDRILSKLDVVIGAVHYKFNLSCEKQTERIIRAMDNRNLNIIAHPSGRLINKRPPYDVEMEQIMEAAADRGCFMELNAHPSRLDLNDLHCREAKKLGAKIAVSTDAHHTSHLDYMKYGIKQARRGWLEADDIINTRDVDALRALLER